MTIGRLVNNAGYRLALQHFVEDMDPDDGRHGTINVDLNDSFMVLSSLFIT